MRCLATCWLPCALALTKQPAWLPLRLLLSKQLLRLLYIMPIQRDLMPHVHDWWGT